MVSDPFHGLKVDSYLTFGNELSEETHVLTKQESLLGSPPPPSTPRPPGKFLPNLQVSLTRIAFRVTVFSEHSDLGWGTHPFT